VREERSHPAEIALYVGVAIEPGVTLRGERAREKEREQEQDDAANLAS
jgi:hypothetical protein